MRIILSSLWYPVSISRYFERAFRRREDVELYTVGPYTGNYIPWNGGMYLPETYARRPDVILRPGGGSASFRYAEERLRVEIGIETWDAWVQVDAGFHLKGEPSKGVNVYVATDPHVLNYDSQRLYADLFFNMQKVYSKPGDHYLPYAYDAELHTPTTIPWSEREYDVVICGLQYAGRVTVGNALRSKGYKVWQGIGPAYEEYRDLHHNSRVGFAWSSKEDLIARVFENLAMGLPLVCNMVPDIEQFFVGGQSYFGFATHPHALDLIEFLLENEARSADAAQNGLNAVQGHTYDARVDQILRTL